MTETAVERLSDEPLRLRKWRAYGSVVEIEHTRDLAVDNAEREQVQRAVNAYVGALARSSEGAEPVAWTGTGSLAAICQGGEGYIWGSSAPAHPLALYLSPQPQGGGEADDDLYMAGFRHGIMTARVTTAEALSEAPLAAQAADEALAALSAPKAPVEGEVDLEPLARVLFKQFRAYTNIANYDDLGPANKEAWLIHARLVSEALSIALSTPSPRVSVEEIARIKQHIGWLTTRAELLAENDEPGDKENAAYFHQIARDLARLSPAQEGAE